MKLEYSEIEQQLIKALPEVSPASEFYWKTEGQPGSDPGPYIFFHNVFATYVEILLAMPLPVSPGRGRLLLRAFRFVEEMFASSDPEVLNLAFIGLYEGQPAWWFERAFEFIGPRAQLALDRFYPKWRNLTKYRKYGAEAIDREFIDLYGVRLVIASELQHEQVNLKDIPGTTHVKEIT